MMVMGMLGNFGSLIIAYVRIKSSNEHETGLQKLVDFIVIGFDVDDTVIGEGD